LINDSRLYKIVTITHYNNVIILTKKIKLFSKSLKFVTINISHCTCNRLVTGETFCNSVPAPPSFIKSLHKKGSKFDLYACAVTKANSFEA